MKKLTMDALDALFTSLNRPDNVFWVRDKSYKKPIYISPTIEKIWGIPGARFYSDTDGKILQSTMVEDEGKEQWQTLDANKNAVAKKDFRSIENQSSDVLLRINDAQGQVRYLIDSSYLLVDQKGNHLGFSGVVQPLTKEEWYARYYASKSDTQLDPNANLKNHIFDLLYHEAGINMKNADSPLAQNQVPQYYVTIQNKDIPFTKRECECIFHLQQGKSAKMTGDALCVSARTVEFHLKNACDKAQVRSKIQLLTVINSKIF